MSIKRKLYTYEEEIKKWIDVLLTKFKKSSFTIMIVIIKEKYNIKNVRRRRKSRKYT